MWLKSMMVVVVAASVLGGASQAETLKFAAGLIGADEVPPNDSTGVGEVKATLDTATRTFSYVATYSGLTGPALAAHFHSTRRPRRQRVTDNSNHQLGKPNYRVCSSYRRSDCRLGSWKVVLQRPHRRTQGGEIRGQLAPGGLRSTVDFSR